MKRWPLLLAFVSSPFALTTAWAGDVSFNWDWMISAQHNSVNEQAQYFPDNRSSNGSISGLLDLEVMGQQWVGLAAIKANDLYHSDNASSVSSEVILRELFWQGSVEVADTSIDITAGKMRLDWGVGYGYRPLDLFKPYRRNPIGIQVEEGAGVLSFSHFDATGEWTLLGTDSSWTSQEMTDLEDAKKQKGIGVRRYGLTGDSEYQLIAYYDDVRKGLVGGSLVSVVDASWEFHGSVVYQNEYVGYHFPTSASRYSVPEIRSEIGAVQALVGLTWASETGHNIVLEYWYDSRAWSNNQWQKNHHNSQLLRQNRNVSDVRYGYANGYQQENIVQHNVMLHWSFDSSGWSHYNLSDYGLSADALSSLTPLVDLLYSPEDSGVILTPKLTYEWLNTGATQFETELAARFLLGDERSAYQNLPDKNMILLNLKGRF
ncbi:hypothetical protein QWZ04_13215 [Vibrio tapetis subsp. quintayensis]|uniref:hypothetical protein n=1 Tax=Vibrio tapetis TaxID=52443 RepID=UPI0025B5DE6E|nr:hypothetical protein [Vibrio tapetis]MDN3681281.1 hypothetical protein [Vibrio tapetis subsp. quintayensis]